MRFIGASHEEGLATRDAVRMRRLVQSDWFQERWPLAMVGDQNAKTYFENASTGWRQSCPVRSMTGRRGDRVTIYLGMVPELPIAMLACARLGAIHSVVFGGFAPAELSARIEDATPKVIVSASCGIEPTRVVPYKPFLDEAIERSSVKPAHRIMLQREQQRAELAPGEHAWDELMASERAQPVGCTPVAATDPLYILYTSGTTGKPKGIVRDNGGHAVALAWSMPNIYGVNPGETMFTASDVGWVVGHSYIVYGPLLVGATTILYEGKPVGTPDAGAFWRILADHHVPAAQAAGQDDAGNLVVAHRVNRSSPVNNR